MEFGQPFVVHRLGGDADDDLFIFQLFRCAEECRASRFDPRKDIADAHIALLVVRYQLTVHIIGKLVNWKKENACQ